jgi:peptidoglycan/xylan/chitin deacetylase (PgdA/CDA1 family)
LTSSSTSLPADYLRYPLRRYGMDHDWYAWSMLTRRPKISWPDGARVALWVAPSLEWFPLDMKGLPFKPPGAMVTAYPDMRHYTLRDYGNRVGIYRIMELLDRHRIRASVAVNAAVAARYPSLVEACSRRGWEVVGHGLDMDHLHHGALPVEEEKALIAKSLEILRKASGQKVRGWLSPAKSESFATLGLLAEAGIEYVCDWINDDMPYAMSAGGRPIHSLPHSTDTDDYTLLIANHHDEDEYRDQVIGQFDVLYAESATQGGRILCLSLNPWVTGQPYRIRTLEEILEHIMRHSGVWPATGAEILDAWKKASD